MDNNNLHTKAIITLVLGIISLLLLLFGWSSIIGLGCGITAIILGKKVKQESSNKESFGNTGYICGLIGTILSAIKMFILIILLLFFGATFNKTLDFVKNNNDAARKTIDKVVEKIDEDDNENITTTTISNTTTTTITTTVSTNNNNNSNDDSKKTIDKAVEKTDGNNNENFTTTTTTTVSTTNNNIDDLKAELLIKEKELSEKTGKIAELQKKITSIIASGDTSQIDAVQSEISALRSEIVTLINEISDLKNKIAN